MLDSGLLAIVSAVSITFMKSSSSLADILNYASLNMVQLTKILNT